MTDYRLREHRRQVFHDFYEFHLRYRSHPGCVYYLMPYLRERFDWDTEEALWFAFLNGNTQNPVTSLLLHHAGPSPEAAEAAVQFWRDNYMRLQFDTDRRYHKKALPAAVAGYLSLVSAAGSQEALWADAAAAGFAQVWRVATAIPTFGRLSAFSYTEYLRVMGVPFDCDTLMLEDIHGSRSHRNGLCIVLGLDRYDWHRSNPGFPGGYPRDVLSYLSVEGEVLRDEARARAAGRPWADDVSYFTLESTLCTYKGWHRVDRRYPNVYNDMLHDRIVAAEAAFPERGDLSVFWDARQECLPVHLRLEDNPDDPGLCPEKQNHYRLTGEPVMMDVEYPRYRNGFNDAVRAGEFAGARPPTLAAA